MLLDTAFSTLRIRSYNVRGYNFTKYDSINLLMSESDILILQEQRLLTAQIVELGYINNHFLVHAITGFDNHEI